MISWSIDQLRVTKIRLLNLQQKHKDLSCLSPFSMNRTESVRCPPDENKTVTSWDRKSRTLLTSLLSCSSLHQQQQQQQLHVCRQQLQHDSKLDSNWDWLVVSVWTGRMNPVKRNVFLQALCWHATVTLPLSTSLSLSFIQLNKRRRRVGGWTVPSDLVMGSASAGSLQDRKENNH